MKRLQFFTILLAVASVNPLLFGSDSSGTGYARSAAIGAIGGAVGLGMKSLYDIIAKRRAEVNKILSDIRTLERKLKDELPYPELRKSYPNIQDKADDDKAAMLKSLAALKLKLEGLNLYLEPFAWDDLILDYWSWYMGVVGRYDIRQGMLEYWIRELQKENSREIENLREEMRMLVKSSKKGSDSSSIGSDLSSSQESLSTNIV